MRLLFPAYLLCACLRAQTAGVEGIAVDAVTHQPLPGVHISMGAIAQESSGIGDRDTYGAISRPDGRFSIASLPPGLYFVNAKHNGYLLVPKKAKGPFQDFTVAVKPGDQLKDFVIEMTPHAVIAGHILDENGDPVQRVEVMAESADRSARPVEGTIAMGFTDDRGEFRLVVPPGKFYVRSTTNGNAMHPWMMGTPEIRSDGFVPPVYGQSYFPGIATQDKAIAVELAPGQVAAGIDFPLMQRFSVSISGIVTAMPAQSGALIRVFGPASQQSAFAGPDGIFTVSGLNPGKYRLLAHSQAQDDSQHRSAWLEVNAETGPVKGVTLALVPGETVSGKLEFAADSAKTTQPEKLSVRLEAAAPDGIPIQGADIGNDGTFHIAQVFPDKYLVRVSPLPDDAYIKTVRLGNTEAPGGVIDLSAGVTGAALTVTLGRGGGHVEGQVVGDDGKPVPDGFALVILAATEDQIDEKNVRQVEPGAKFAYSGLPPGRYRIIALEPEQFMGRREDPDKLKALLGAAPEFEIHQNDKLTKDLKFTAAEEAGAK